MNTILTADNLFFSYDRTPVLKGLSFSIDKGDFFIIIGANGTGKSTLLKTLCGYHAHFTGKVTLCGRSLKEYSQRSLSRIMAVLPQDAPAALPFTVRQTVLLGRSPHQGLLGLETKDDKGIVQNAMERTGIEHLSKRSFHELSGGERQRVLIARALAQEPDILLLDEPTASLDLSHQTRIMDLLFELREERGLTVLMVSHDLNLAALYGNKLLLLENGNVGKLGSPAEVLDYSTLEKAYGCILLVDKSPLGNVPRINLVPKRYLHGIGGRG